MISTSKYLQYQWLQMFACLKYSFLIVLISGCIKQSTTSDLIINDESVATSIEKNLHHVDRTNLNGEAPHMSPPNTEREMVREMEMRVRKKPTAQWPDLQAYAEPITPDTIRRFPHLEEFQGHLVLGNKFSQIVISGVPADNRADDWQRVIIAEFDWDTRWQPNKSMGVVSIAPPNQNGKNLVLMAVDFESSPSQNMAKVFLVFDNNNQARNLVEISINDNEPKVGIHFLNSNHAISSAWPIRLSDQYGDILFDETPKNIDLHNRLSHYFDNHIVTIFSYSPFTQKSSDFGNRILSPLSIHKGRPFPVQGFEFWLGSISIEETVFRETALKKCSFPKSKSLLQLESCVKRVPNALVKLKLSNLDQGLDEIPFPLHITDGKGGPIAYAPIFSGGSEQIKVAANTAYGLIDSRFGNMIQGFEIKSFEKNEVWELEIPPRLFATVSINVDDEKLPAIVDVTNLDLPSSGRSLLKTSKLSGAEIVGPNKINVSEWPLQLRLIEGNYNINVVRQRGTTLCSMNISILKNQNVSLHCNEIEMEEMSLEGAMVDLRESPSLDMKKNISKLSGKAWFAGKDQSVNNEIPMDSTKDVNLGVELRWIGASDTKAIKELARFKNDLIKYRDKVSEKDGVVELGCPAPGMSALEYQNLIEKFQPDLVRAFGCVHGKLQEQYLSSIGRATTTLKKNILISVADNSHNSGGGLNYSYLRLFANADESNDSPEAVVQKIAAGQYSVSNGAFIRLKHIEWDGSKKIRITLKVVLESQNSLESILIYSESGKSYGIPIDKNVPKNSELTILSIWDPEDKFVRIEAIGTDSNTIQNSDEASDYKLHLGTTNFSTVPEPKL